MIMRAIDQVVAYCMQISMYNFIGVAIVMANAYNGVFYHGIGILRVYREIVEVLEFKY